MGEKCRNCGKELEGLETCWASRDGLFCSEDCGVLFNYELKPITDTSAYTCIALAMDAQQPFEDLPTAMERVQYAATKRWEETAEEISDFRKGGTSND